MRVAGVRDGFEDQPLDVGHFAPVPLDGLHDQLDARRIADKLVGPQADRMLAKALIPHLFNIFLWDDPARSRGHGAVKGHEIGPRLHEMDAYPVGIDDLHLLELLAMILGHL